MNIKDQISAEIERRLKAIANSPSDGGEMDAINGARCLELMSFRKYIDSLPEQPVEKTSYDTQKYTPSPSVSIEDVARVQFASHAKLLDKKRKAVFDWEQFKEVASIFYGFGKKDSPETKEKEQPASDFCKENCKENCKGFQETGRCFLDGPCYLAKKPASDGLEDEIVNYYGNIPDDKDKVNAARHFAEWGAKHTKK